MARNQAALQEMGVSSAHLDHLIATAVDAGALGAKLSGAGRAQHDRPGRSNPRQEEIAAALRTAGAVRTIITTVQSTQ
jgi:mevalonate kinase